MPILLSLTTIAPRELCRLCESGAGPEIVDVRTPAEFAGCHIASARLIPLQRVAALGPTRGEAPVYVVCQSGARAAKAAGILRGDGCRNVVVVEGGMAAWEEAGLPVVRGRTSMSLERQVRIAAGLLVLLGVVLGSMVAPVFYGLSAFVGAGLVFAGLTDTCAMGLLIAKLPWNQRSKA